MRYMTVAWMTAGIGLVALSWFFVGYLAKCSAPDNYTVKKVFSNGAKIAMDGSEKFVVVPIGSEEDAAAIWPAYVVKFTIEMDFCDMIVDSGPFLLTSTPGYEGRIVGGKRVYSIK